MVDCKENFKFDLGVKGLRVKHFLAPLISHNQNNYRDLCLKLFSPNHECPLLSV